MAPFVLVLDNVRDPGNVGTIIRTACALGVEKILLTKGCVNVWSSKVLRSSMGAHFKTRIYDNLDVRQVKYFISKSSHVLLAEVRENSISCTEIQRHFKMQPLKHVSLIMGNETRGISADLRKSTNEINHSNQVTSIKICLNNGVESLNCAIAFAIIAYEIKKCFE